MTRFLSKKFPLLLFLAFVFWGMPCFAAGGACPTAANYLNPANPGGNKITLAGIGVTNCFYIAANGSDSNNGTSEATPWLHAPGMSSCTGTCKSTTPAAGEGFIFRGGDTWHSGNSGASPYTGGTWNWNWSGTSGNHIYIGVDQTWFSGSGWARPIINGDNPLNSVSGSGAGVSSCQYGGGGANLVNLSAIYEHFDNFELLGMCWGTSGGTYISTSGLHQQVQGSPNPNPRWVENNYIHGWSHVKYNCNANGGVCASSGEAFDGNGGQPGNGALYGVIIQFNVVDGADSDSYSLAWVGPSGQADAWIVQYNVIRYNGADNTTGAVHLFHDNLFEYGFNADDGATHTDWPMQIYGAEANDPLHPGDGTPNLFYNNVVRHIPGALSAVLWQFPPPGYSDYDFNNVFSDYEGGCGNYNNVDQGSGRGNLVVFNNTEEGCGAPNPSGCIYCNGDSGSSKITAANNHWIISGGFGAVFQNSSVVTETSALYQTLPTATAQGFSVANNFAPTLPTNATVTTLGTNETNGFCSQLQNSAAQTACETGITGVAYNSTNHSVIYPATPPVPRPASGPWNVGAYQFSSSSSQAPQPPTGIQISVQ